MFNKTYLKDLAERVIATMAQAAFALVIVGETIQELDWKTIAGATALAGLAAVLKGLAAKGVGDEHNASLIKPFDCDGCK